MIFSRNLVPTFWRDTGTRRINVNRDDYVVVVIIVNKTKKYYRISYSSEYLYSVVIGTGKVENNGGKKNTVCTKYTLHYRRRIIWFFGGRR